MSRSSADHLQLKLESMRAFADEAKTARDDIHALKAALVGNSLWTGVAGP